ncbi:hypothetical protein BGZ93_010886 [Podila epicladia]|nr:hypothetical protein BGZ92_009296 [Podila epicladia]KAG0100563.1 hypothetical protein BGZ93_010886 [Podila epicladia]
MPHCKLCHKLYRSKSSLKSHYYDSHDGKSERVTNVECPLEGCTASFESRTGFSYHCKRHAEEWEHQRQSAPSEWSRLSLDLARELEIFDCQFLDIEFTHDENEEELHHPSYLFSTLGESKVQDNMLAQAPLHDKKAMMESTLDSDVDFMRARLATFAESYTPTNDVALNEYFSSLWERSCSTIWLSSRVAPTVSPRLMPEDILEQDQEHRSVEAMLHEVRERLRVAIDPDLEAIYRILFQEYLD